MNSAMFSCVIPVIGARPYFKDALASIEKQGVDVEVIVQDGDVTSIRTEELGIRNCDGLDICWYKEADTGQSDALNRGFLKAKGEWLFWLNADDILLPGALQNVAKVIATLPSDVEWIVGNEIFMDKDNKIIKCLRGNKWHDWLYRYAVPHVYGPSAFFKKGLLDLVGGLDTTLNYCMDWDLWIRFMKAGAKFHRVNEYLWGQRQWEGSKTQRKLPKEQHRTMWSEIEQMLKRNGLQTTFLGSTVMRLWRFFNGNIPLQTLDIIRYRGRTISQIFG